MPLGCRNLEEKEQLKKRKYSPIQQTTTAMKKKIKFRH